MLHFFLWTNIPLYGRSHFAFLSSKAIRAVVTFCLLGMLVRTFGYKFLFEYLYSVLLDICPAVELWGSYDKYMFNRLRNPRISFSWFLPMCTSDLTSCLWSLILPSPPPTSFCFFSSNWWPPWFFQHMQSSSIIMSSWHNSRWRQRMFLLVLAPHCVLTYTWL